MNNLIDKMRTVNTRYNTENDFHKQNLFIHSRQLFNYDLQKSSVQLLVKFNQIHISTLISTENQNTINIKIYSPHAIFL